MSEKTLKFCEKFHASKQAINLSLIDTDKVVMPDKFKYSDNGSKYLLAI